MKILRKAAVPVMIATLLLLVSCSTTSFMGLSRSRYVDEELELLRSEMTEMNIIKADFEETVEDLNLLADRFADRLDEMPEETLRQLMAAIEEYLDEDQPEEPAPPSEAPSVEAPPADDPPEPVADEPEA